MLQTSVHLMPPTKLPRYAPRRARLYLLRRSPLGLLNMKGRKSSTHIISGSYERIAKKMFTDLDHDSFYLEYDSERAGDFEPLRHLPVSKNVVLGVVSTQSPAMEDVEELVTRVYKAAEVIAQGQGRSVKEVLQTSLAVSPQCGFASMSPWRRPRDDHGYHVGEASIGKMASREDLALGIEMIVGVVGHACILKGRRAE